MNLFDYMRSSTQEKESPLASRMRPTTLDEVVGQKHIIGKDKLLYRAIQADPVSYTHLDVYKRQVVEKWYNMIQTEGMSKAYDAVLAE